MRDKNQVIIRGRLGDQPKYTSGNGTTNSRASLSVCTNYEYTNAKGEEVSVPQWHNVVVWGKSADNASKYLIKGQQVEVTGRLQTREYETEGQTRRITEIVADAVEYGLKPKTETQVAAKASEPIATKRQQTVVRKKPSSQIKLDIQDDEDAF